MSNQQLILRSNRFLAATLLENRLISSDDVEKANSKLLSYFQNGKMQYASVLRILIHDLKVLDEAKLIQHMVTRMKAGLIDLSHSQISPHLIENLDIDECWATMTLPFDKIGTATCLATCYQLSKPVIELWENKYEHVLWYTTTVNSLTATLESLRKNDEEIDQAK